MITERDTDTTSPIPETQHHCPSHRGVMIAAGVMIFFGFGGLAFLITNILPYMEYVWLFLMLFFVASAGLALPFVRYLNVRFARPDDMPTDGVLLRQGIWVGVFFTTSAWLRIVRTLNVPVAFFLALSLAAVEIFLRVRERSLH